MEQLIYAKEADIGKKSWLLRDLKTITFPGNMTTPVVEQLDKKEISVQEELSDIQSTSNASDFLSLKELAQYIKKNKEAGLNMTSFEVDYYNKFSFPFTIFVLSLMVVPFVVGQGQSVGFSKNVFLIISMTFSFWMLYSFFIFFWSLWADPSHFGHLGSPLFDAFIHRLLFLFKKNLALIFFFFVV